MDLLTQYYYSNHAEQLSRKQVDYQTEGIVDWFDSAFPEGSSVLDIGAGSGVHLARLLEADHEAWGVEPCQAFIAGAEAMYPQVQGRIFEDSFPYLHDIPDSRFDGVLCSAVLMHVPEEQLFEALCNLRRVLRPGGTFLVSLPLDRGGKPLRGRDTRGLLFNGLSPLRLELILARMGFVCTGRGESPDIYGRRGRKMGIRLFVRGGASGEDHFVRIQSALQRDHEMTTYGAGLIRVVAETGLTRYNSVRCLDDNTVSIPLGTLVEKWLELYWPLAEETSPTPQVCPTAPESLRAIDLRDLLSEMISRFSSRGGLSAFLIARRTGSLNAEEFELYKKLMARLCDTMRLGAILHARDLGEEEPLFRYDRRSRSLLIERSVWNSFSLQGSRIRDVATLRWAALLEAFSGGGVTRGKALKLLVRPPVPESQVSEVRQICLADPEPSCVWTGETLRNQDLEIMRGIPFTYWRNNHLWNLFPTRATLLSLQGEGLPSRRLLLDRKRFIMDHWVKVSTIFPERFRSESSLLAGAILTHQRNWPQRLFSLFSEAVEFTARQLKVPRWDPEE